MPHSQSFDALVLKTYDVGEADRLCVLFTRENGRMMARASGARRMTSRLGGSLLPYTRLTVELKEGAGGWFIAGVQGRQGGQRRQGVDIHAFTALQEGIELLLRLVTDEGALPDVFQTTAAFMDACQAGQPHAVLSYTFSLLHALGLLPGEGEIGHTESFTPAEQGYLRLCRSGHITDPDPSCDLGKLQRLRSGLLDELLASPLKTVKVSEAMR